MEMNDVCGSVSGLLEKYFDHEVTTEESVLVQDHLNRCQDCRAALEAMEELRDRILIPAEALPDEEAFERLWLNIRRETAHGEKPSWRESLHAYLDFSILLRKKVWIPAASMAMVLLLFAFTTLFKKNTSLEPQFGVEYVESNTNNIMVYELEATKVTVIWLFEGPEQESTS
jgi:hypothetical protein